MTAEPDLLPLPDAYMASEFVHNTFVYGANQMQAYARACVSSATEALRERMRAEDEAAEREIRHQHARAERLAEALRELCDECNTYGHPEASVLERGYAALEQENGRG